MAPEYLVEMYYPVEEGLKTRFSFQKLILPCKTTNRGLRMLSYLGPRLWNALHREIKSASSANNFKHKIKNNFVFNFRRRKIAHIFITKRLCNYRRSSMFIILGNLPLIRLFKYFAVHSVNKRATLCGLTFLCQPSTVSEIVELMGF